jgi:O-antigen/teichoic acid export membrane protein
MTPLSDQRSASGETVRRMFDDVAALGRKYALSLGGEALQSGFHFILNLLLIRALPAYDYGVFAIVFILGGISITYGNALVSIPANIRIARLRSARAVAFLDVAFGSVALAICLGVAVIVASGLWLTTDRPGESLAGGAFVGIWTLRNHVRSTMFARQRASTVTLSDGFYTATGAALVAGLLGLRSQVPQATMILLFLTAANAVAIAAALAMPRRPIRISFRRGVRRSYRAIFGEIGWSLIWVTTWNIQGQGLMFMVAAIVGPAAYAPIAAGIVLFGPLRTGVGAFINVVRPEFACGLAEERYRQVKLTLFGSFAVIAWVCVAYGAAVWMGWPLLAQYVYGAKFANASMPLIVLLAWLTALVATCYHVPLALVQAALDFKAVAISTITGGLVGMASIVLLIAFSTVAWSLAGAAAGEAVALTYICVAALRVLSRPHPTAPAGIARHAVVPEHAQLAL